MAVCIVRTRYLTRGAVEARRTAEIVNQQRRKHSSYIEKKTSHCDNPFRKTTGLLVCVVNRSVPSPSPSITRRVEKLVLSWQHKIFKYTLHSKYRCSRRALVEGQAG